MPDRNNNPTPLFSCRNQLCAEVSSYHADMLAMHPDGGVVCEDCWTEETAKPFSDLPPFKPTT